MIKYKKEIWLRFDDKEKFSAQEAEIYQISDKCSGDYEVVFYLSKTHEVKRPKKFTAQETANEFGKILGEDNVKVICEEREWYEPKQEVCALDRIADALEGINASLEKISNSVELLEKLSDCVSEREYGGFFSVSGSITADVR